MRWLRIWCRLFGHKWEHIDESWSHIEPDGPMIRAVCMRCGEDGGLL